jgi:hypothetical protein
MTRVPVALQHATPNTAQNEMSDEQQEVDGGQS